MDIFLYLQNDDLLTIISFTVTEKIYTCKINML